MAAGAAVSPIYWDEVGADDVIGPARLLLRSLVVREVGGVPDDEIGAIDGLVLDEAIRPGLLGQCAVIDLIRPVAQEPQVTHGEWPVARPPGRAVVGTGADLVALAGVAISHPPP